MEIIETALKQGQHALSEFDSKKILKTAGIPVTREMLATTEDEAVAAAKDIGFPVALKPCAWELMHKSETGTVRLNLEDAEAVTTAYRDIRQKISQPLDGILVQEMAQGSRELVVGMSRDAQFGVCIMLGYGGTMTEIIKDTVFRVTPFDKTEALDMICELKTAGMLDPFRGQQAADLETVSRIILAVAQLGLQEPSISEIDVNPLIISNDGTVKAADALIVLERS